jgi:TRAP-type C4-dicarboxylate transport system substrate-binding protein
MEEESIPLKYLTGDDFWHELPPEVKQIISKAKAELDRGEGSPHSEVMAELRNRYQVK